MRKIRSYLTTTTQTMPNFSEGTVKLSSRNRSKHCSFMVLRILRNRLRSCSLVNPKKGEAATCMPWKSYITINPNSAVVDEKVQLSSFVFWQSVLRPCIFLHHYQCPLRFATLLITDTTLLLAALLVSSIQLWISWKTMFLCH